MEALLFVCDSVVMVLILYMGVRDDRRAKGSAQTSLFRMRDAPAPPVRARRGRR